MDLYLAEPIRYSDENSTLNKIQRIEHALRAVAVRIERERERLSQRFELTVSSRKKKCIWVADPLK